MTRPGAVNFIIQGIVKAGGDLSVPGGSLKQDTAAASPTTSRALVGTFETAPRPPKPGGALPNGRLISIVGAECRR
jgi:hypothetical protein